MMVVMILMQFLYIYIESQAKQTIHSQTGHKNTILLCYCDVATDLLQDLLGAVRKDVENEAPGLPLDPRNRGFPHP